MSVLRTLAAGTLLTHEIEIKRSRFITTLARTDTPEEARALIDAVKSDHPQARHNCSAYLIDPPDAAPLQHSSDDGEPSGTAGTPMLEALRASGATYGQIVAQAVVPMSITSVISWVMYMIETNIRDATLIGLLTGTGIGFVFDVYYKSFRYDIAGLVILSIVLVVIACELTSNFVRRKVI